MEIDHWLIIMDWKNSIIIWELKMFSFLTYVYILLNNILYVISF